MEHQDQRMKAPETHNPNHHHQPPPPQKCPRCESSNTKFCYYNNYSLSQPRYFCKACRRYWTHGGTLRNVPVGGGCRKSKRPKPSAAAASSSSSGAQSLPPAFPLQGNLAGMNPGSGQGMMRPLHQPMPQMGNTFYSGGSFLSTLAGMQHGGPAASMGGGSSQYELLQGVSLPSLMKPQPPPPPPQQFQVNNEYFQSRPPLTWTQSFINRGPAATSSAATPDFWSGAAASGGGGGENQGGPSFNPNHWPENNHGFDASQ